MKSQEIGWRAVTCPPLDSTQPLLCNHNWHYLHQTWTRLASSIISHGKKGAHGALTLPSEQMATNGAWERWSIVFSYVPTADLTRLQQITPNPESHRGPWLNSVGHNTKLIDRNIRKKPVVMWGSYGVIREMGEGWRGWSLCIMYMYEMAKIQMWLIQ